MPPLREEVLMLLLLLGLISGWWLSGLCTLLSVLSVHESTSPSVRFWSTIFLPLAAFGGAWSCELLMLLLNIPLGDE